jgi:hypothetical protein
MTVSYLTLATVLLSYQQFCLYIVYPSLLQCVVGCERTRLRSIIERRRGISARETITRTSVKYSRRLLLWFYQACQHM